MKILIKNAKIFQKDKFIKGDVLIERKKITKLGGTITVNADKIIDAQGACVFPGFIDLHSHSRDPGHTYKEDIVTGTKAAAH